jgi:hypothetical protein
MLIKVNAYQVVNTTSYTLPNDSMGANYTFHNWDEIYYIRGYVDSNNDRYAYTLLCKRVWSDNSDCIKTSHYNWPRNNENLFSVSFYSWWHLSNVVINTLYTHWDLGYSTLFQYNWSFKFGTYKEWKKYDSFWLYYTGFKLYFVFIDWTDDFWYYVDFMSWWFENPTYFENYWFEENQLISASDFSRFYIYWNYIFKRKYNRIVYYGNEYKGSFSISPVDIWKSSDFYISGNAYFADINKSYYYNINEDNMYWFSWFLYKDNTFKVFYANLNYSGLTYNNWSFYGSYISWNKLVIDEIIADTNEVETITLWNWTSWNWTSWSLTIWNIVSNTNKVSYNCLDYNNQIFCQTATICGGEMDFQPIFKYLGTGNYQFIINQISWNVVNQGYYFIYYNWNKNYWANLWDIEVKNWVIRLYYYYNWAIVDTGSLYYPDWTGDFINFIDDNKTFIYPLWSGNCYSIAVLYPEKFTYSGYIEKINPENKFIWELPEVNILDNYKGLYDCSNLSIFECIGKIAKDTWKLIVDTITKPIYNLQQFTKLLQEIKPGTCSYTGYLIWDWKNENNSIINHFSWVKIGLTDYILNIWAVIVWIIFTFLLLKKDE